MLEDSFHVNTSLSSKVELSAGKQWAAFRVDPVLKPNCSSWPPNIPNSNVVLDLIKTLSLRLFGSKDVPSRKFFFYPFMYLKLFNTFFVF